LWGVRRLNEGFVFHGYSFPQDGDSIAVLIDRLGDGRAVVSSLEVKPDDDRHYAGGAANDAGSRHDRFRNCGPA